MVAAGMQFKFPRENFLSIKLFSEFPSVSFGRLRYEEQACIPHQTKDKKERRKRKKSSKKEGDMEIWYV